MFKEIEKITNTLTRLNIQSAEDTPADSTDYELTVKAAGDTLTYRFFKDGSEHFVRRDDYSQTFRINKSDYEKITGQTTTQLVHQMDIEEAEENTIADSEPDKSAQNLSTSEHNQEVMQKENS